MKYQINKQNCMGINRCGICLRNCPFSSLFPVMDEDRVWTEEEAWESAEEEEWG